MTREELLASLNLPAPGKNTSQLQVTDEDTPDNLPPASETALQLDDWSLRRGAEVLAESEKLRGLFDVPTFDIDQPLGKPAELSQAQLATADFHAAAFEPSPQIAERCKNERIHRYMKNLMETPEFQQLHSETQLDESASEIATAAFAEKWVEYSKQAEPEGEFKKDMQAMGAAAGALQQASQEVAELRDAQDALGLGHGGEGSSKLNCAQLSGMLKRVKDSQALKRICERAGRFRRYMQARQRKKTLHGLDDVVGVVLDGEISRLLPTELAALDDEDLENDILRRIVERQAMCRDYRGLESKAKGPIVIVVDESGSMSGDPIYNAKAIALSLASLAQSQHRYCCLVGFSGGTEGTFCVLPPGRRDQEALLDWLEHFFGQGTTLEVPLEVLPARWKELGCPRGITDLIIVTDAVCHIPEPMRESFLVWKAVEQVKLITLVMGHEPGDMTLVSDRVHCVSTLGIEEEAVAEVLSI